MRQQYESLGRDLFFKAECHCPDPKWAGTDVAHIFKRKVRLTGYADDNFFDNVHKAAHEGKCDCGREFTYQWFPDGVEFSWRPVATTKEQCIG